MRMGDIFCHIRSTCRHKSIHGLSTLLTNSPSPQPPYTRQGQGKAKGARAERCSFCGSCLGKVRHIYSRRPPHPSLPLPLLVRLTCATPIAVTSRARAPAITHCIRCRRAMAKLSLFVVVRGERRGGRRMNETGGSS